MVKKHNKSISIAKGIAITLMVLGHSPATGIIADWMYSFRMPLFFFVSGYLFKDRHLSDPIRYFRNKVKGYYIPFVKWTLIFILLHNLFASVNIYDYYYDASVFLDRIIRAFTMRGSEQLLGGYWFLIDGFFSSLIAYSLIYLCNRLSSKVLPPPPKKKACA